MDYKYILFGAGVTGKGAVNYIGKEYIEAVIDNFPGKIGTLFEGIPVISFQEYLEKYRDLKVVVSVYSKNYFDVKKQLEENNVFDYFTLPPVIYGFCLPEELAKDVSGIKRERIIFYDVNPVSIRMYKWIQEYSNRKCYFIKALKEKKILKYEEQYPFLLISDLTSNDVLVITTNEVEESIREYIKPYFSGEIYDIYKNANLPHKELLKYKDKYKGHRCFLIGNGPSLQAEDLDRIYKCGDISFASNRIYLIYKLTKWRPTYYTMIDRIGLVESDRKLKELAESSCFFADYYYTNWEHSDNVNYVSMINKIYKNEKIIFSNDITKGVASGRTVTYTMLQLACYMGFSKIYLLGVDFSWGENGSDTHFCKGYSDEKEENYQRNQAILDKEEIRQAYISAKNYAEQHNIHIYNATRGGYLDVFERVDFDSLFET